MKKLQIELKWAILFSVALLCWILFEKTMGWYQDEISDFWWLTLFFEPFALLIYLLALREKRRVVYNRKITWAQAILSGVIISFIVAILSPITEYIAYNFFTPENFNAVSESSVTNELMARSKLNDVFNINNYRWESAFGLFGFGILNTIVAGFFVRKK